jgi:hypothetical protein
MEIKKLEQYSWMLYDVKDQLRRFVYDRSDEAFAAGDAARDAVQTKDQLEARKIYIREKLIEGIGGLPSSDTPLNAKVTDIVEGEGFRVEKVIYESRPNTYVTSNLYIPDGITAPRGAVLFVCGHHDQAKHQPEYQIVCRYLVKAGLVVLAIDPIGQGERFSYYESSIQESTVSPGTSEHDYAGSQCWPLGDGLARYFVHDAMRGIDYLCTRPEVDPDKIGITGNSGGGTQCSLVMICDPRVAAAAPATFIMNRQTYMHANQAQDAEQIWPGMTALGFDHEDILLSMVPKPVLVLAVKYDFFPIEGTRRTVERTRRFWEMYGKDNSFGLFEDASIHKYTRPMAKKAAEFFSWHLLGNMASPSDQEVEPITPSLLWCTKSGQVRGEMENSRAAFEENRDRVNELETIRTSTSENERKEKALIWLKEKVFASRKPCDLNPRYMPMSNIDEMMVENSIWWSQEGIFNHAYTFRNYLFLDKSIPLSIAVWDGGTTQLLSHLEWIRKTSSSGRAVMVLDVSGVGALIPHSFNKNNDPLDFYEVIHKLTDDLFWLNDSMAALRTYDVLRAIDMAEQMPHIDKNDIQIYAYGRQSLYAQMSSVLDKRIKGIQVVNGMGSITDWIRERHYNNYDIISVMLPGMLKYFDLPDLAQWVSQD